MQQSSAGAIKHQAFLHEHSQAFEPTPAHSLTCELHAQSDHMFTFQL